MVDNEQLLISGAFLPVDETVQDSDSVDLISARVYCHPAFGLRRVVRLVADTLAPGEDLILAYLGFSKPEVPRPIAKRRRQALGFPAWALVHDPEHAGYALELVKDFRKAVRQARVKPGNGYDALLKVSQQLGKSVAHFLPSFWEQAGREFLSLDNRDYASRSFNNAREAEKVHGLKVDESVRTAVFLEFTLAGAVSVKALAAYAKELLKCHAPLSAWKIFRELCVRRTWGGMSLWTALVKDVKPLITSAGLNQEHEVQSLLADVIEAPSISRTPRPFWETVTHAMKQLVRINARAAGIMLNMVPPSGGSDDGLWKWLAELREWEILSHAWDEKIPEEAKPAGGPAAWLAKVYQNTGDRPQQEFYDLIETMAPRLKQDAVPVDFYRISRWSGKPAAEVDVIDLALELRIPIVDPGPDIDLELAQWAWSLEQEQNVRNRPRNPVSLTQDPRFRRALHSALQEVAGDPRFEAVATRMTALREPRRVWLNELIDRLIHHGLPAIESSLEQLETRTTSEIFQEFPDALDKLKQVNLVPTIARTIRSGLMDEYGWPAFERLSETVSTGRPDRQSLFGQFPYLIFTDGLKATVLKGDQIVHETELHLTTGQWVRMLMYVDGDLIVWTDSPQTRTCFWNSTPQQLGPDVQYFSTHLAGIVIDLPEGGSFAGSQIIHRGDSGPLNLTPDNGFVSAQSHWWKMSSHYDGSKRQHVWNISLYYPVTGQLGRQSMPSFFEDFLGDGEALEMEHCSLLPVGTVFDHSPLGVNEGLIGYRVRHNCQEKRRIEGVDGRFLETSGPTVFSALLDQPGTTSRLPLEPLLYERRLLRLTIWDPTAEFEIAVINDEAGPYNQGQACFLPLLYLSAFQVRDPNTSKKLRRITDGEVQSLLESARKDIEAASSETTKIQHEKPQTKSRNLKQGIAPEDQIEEPDGFPRLNRAVDNIFGAQIDSRLKAGLRGVLILGVQKTQQLEKLVPKRSLAPIRQAADVALATAEAASHRFLSSLRCGYPPLIPLNFLTCATEVSRFFKAEISRLYFPQPWFGLLQGLLEDLPLKAWKAYSLDPTEQSWIAFVKAWCDMPLIHLPGKFRRYIGTSSSDDLLADETAALLTDDQPVKHASWSSAKWVIPYAGKTSRCLVAPSYKGFEVLEYAPSGQFENIPGLDIKPDSNVNLTPSHWSATKLTEFARLAESNPLNIPAPDFLRSVANEITSSVAEVALIWFGLPNFEDYSPNFMPAHLRTSCRLKAAECHIGRNLLNELPLSTRESLVKSILAGEPAELWENPPVTVANRLQNAWQDQRLERLALPGEISDDLTDAWGRDVNQIKLLQALASPLNAPLFHDQTVWMAAKKRHIVEFLCQTELDPFDEKILRACVITIALLSYGLPVGDPSRDKMKQVYSALRRALANPQLLMEIGISYIDPNSGVPAATIIEPLLGKLRQEQGYEIADNGIVCVAYDSQLLRVAIRPAALRSATEWERVSNLIVALLSHSNSKVSPQSLSGMTVLRIVRSASFQSLAQRLEETPVPVGHYEMNPQLSVPELVQRVALELKISIHAATCYLQILTLPDPTDKNILRWNGWKSPVLKQAVQELIDRKLVLQATRARSGRKAFLPGGWENLNAPQLPFESWKIPLYQADVGPDRKVKLPLGRILILEPVHSLFERAWQRIVTGDIPKYDEVTTK